MFDYEQKSFENLVYFNKERLIEVHRTNKLEVFTELERRKLRKKGLIRNERITRFQTIHLTERCLKALIDLEPSLLFNY